MEKEILVTRSSMPPFEEYVNEIRELWDSRWLTNFGVKHRALEQALAEYLEVDYVMPGVNGHQSLECLIESMDLKGEVITTPFTFASTTHALIPAACSVLCHCLHLLSFLRYVATIHLHTYCVNR